jgi:hypothetical protein
MVDRCHGVLCLRRLHVLHHALAVLLLLLLLLLPT